MRRMLISLTVLFLAASAGFAQSTTKETLKKMEDEVRAATIKGDPSVGEKYFASDYQVVSAITGQMYTKQQLLDRTKSGAAKYSQIDVASEDVAMFGDSLAVTHGVADVKMTMDGQEFSGKVHFARTWLKRNGKWEAVWFQTTKIP